jgi:hypothetical protein
MLFLNWTSAADPGMPSRHDIAGSSHWNLWRTKQPPFNELVDGTDVVLVDSWPGAGRLTWQVRARQVIAAPYPTKADAVRQIGRALGISPSEIRNHPYTVRGPDSGVLLAWSYAPTRRLDLPRPPDMRFRPNGWLRVQDVNTLKRWGLTGGVTQPAVASKKPPLSPISQGRLGPAERVTVEDHAMQQAMDWCRRNGWPIVEDVSRRRSWDLEARKRRNGQPLFIEVKGTTGNSLEIEVTHGEVQHAKDNPTATILIVVTAIVLKRRSQPTATGGTLHVINPWSPSDDQLSPTRYRWRPPRAIR